MKRSAKSVKRMRSFGKSAVSQDEARGSTSVARLGILIFLIGAIILAAVAYVFYQVSVEQSDESRRHEIAQTAENLADRIGTLIQQNGLKMELLVKDAALVQLVEKGSAAEWGAKEAELAYLFPSAVRVRIIPPGLEEVDLEASPPISYATLDMLREAETKEEAPAAEVHLLGTPQQHINMVRRILSSSGRRIVGHLMVNFPLPTLQEALDRSQFARGYGEVWQVAGTVPVSLATRGDPGLKQGEPDVKVAVAGTRWQVAYWVPRGGALESTDTLLAIGGGSIAVFGLLLLLLFRWFRTVLLQDQTLLLSAVRDASSGRLQSSYGIRLRECAGSVAGVRKLFQRAAGSGPEVMGGIGDEISAPALAGSASFADMGTIDVATIGVAEVTVDPAIFRAYDIRGIVDTNFTPEVVYEIGRAIGSEARARGEQSIALGRDGRLSGPELSKAVTRGILATGCNVKAVGQVPTPVLYFAAQYLDTRSGVMLTGSHNPPDYNGLKIVLAGETLSGESIQGLRERIQNNEFEAGQGTEEQVDVLADYIEQIRSDVLVARPMTLVVDCGNGVAGEAAPALLDALGCTVIKLYCEIDGNFPNHHPDPSKPENIADLIQAVKENKADLGLAFDGDGDRLGLVDSDGKIIWPDRLMMLFAMDILGRNPGAEVIYDVKCSRHLAKIIRDFGGIPEMWKTGHSLIKARMKETGALLAGEMSGHIFFKERWFGFDDALYSAARLVEILSNDHRTSASVFGALPDSVNTPELNVPMAEGEAHSFIERFMETHNFDDAEVSTIDGVRADFEDGWGLVRASNTTPVLVLRFEADNQAALSRIQDRFRAAMRAVKPDIALPF